MDSLSWILSYEVVPLDNVYFSFVSDLPYDVPWFKRFSNDEAQSARNYERDYERKSFLSSFLSPSGKIAWTLITKKIYILDEGSMMSKRTVKSGAGGGREYWISRMAAPTKMIGECDWMKTTCIYSDCSLGFEKMTKLVFTLFCHLSLQLFLRFDEHNCFELIFSHLQWAIAFQNCKFTLHF